MTMRPALLALLSHWWRNPLQLFTLLVGLALATALWSGVQAINAEARASYGEAATQVTQGQSDHLVPAKDATLTMQDFVALRRAGLLVSPRIEGEIDVDGKTLRLLGIEPLTSPRSFIVTDLQDLQLDQFLSREGFALVAQDTARLLPPLGLKFAIEESLPAGVAVVDITVAARILGRDDALDYLVILPDQPKAHPPLGDVAPHLTRIKAQDSNDDIARLTDSFHLNLTAFGLLSFAVGLFIVYGAIGLAFEQRRAMFRTLRALGVSLRALIFLLLAELLIFACIAGFIGILLGYLIAAALLPDVAATLRGLYGADLSGGLHIRANWWLSGLAMAIGGTLIASAGTLFRLTRVPLMEAGTPQAWLSASRRVINAMAILGLALLLISGALGALASGLIAGFALLGALLIGSAFLLPWTLDRSLAIMESAAKRALPQWFWADTRSQVPGLSMALMALLLAIATNVGVSTMVSSFRLTFTGWLDQRLAAELYVSVESADQATDLQKFLAHEVDAILPIINTPTRLNGQMGELYAVRDHATYRENWPLLSQTPDVWDRLQTSGHALVNEQLARRAQLRLGDAVPGLRDHVIIGIYSDYGNPEPQAIIGIESFNRLYPNIAALRFGLRVADSDIERVSKQLIDDFNLPPTAMTNQARLKAGALGVFEQTFTVTAALNVLTLSVAGFSIMMSLLTLSQMRLPQLAPIWALGITRAQLGRLELLRSVVLAVGVTCLAIPLGLALSWTLLAVVNVAAFGWQLPIFLFPKFYVLLSLIAIFAAIVAASWPALRLARTAPHQLLQVFSSAR